MKKLPKMGLRVVQFWMSAALLLAVVLSAVIAAPFLLFGKIMDYLERRNYSMKHRLPEIHNPSKHGYF
jgi:hypothetical protein